MNGSDAKIMADLRVDSDVMVLVEKSSGAPTPPGSFLFLSPLCTLLLAFLHSLCNVVTPQEAAEVHATITAVPWITFIR